MADNNQEKPQAVQEEKKPPQPSALERIAEEGWKAVKGAVNTTIAAAAIGAATYLYNIGGLVTAASFPIGRKISDGLAGIVTKIKDYRDEALVGLGLTPAIYTGLEILKQIPNVFGLDSIITNILGYSIPLTSSLTAAGLTFGILNPLLNALYYPLDYLIKNKKISGIGKYFKDNYVQGLKDTLPLNIATSALVGISYAIGVPTLYLLPLFAIAGVGYRILLKRRERKIEYKRLLYPSTYLPNSLNPFYLPSGFGQLYGRFTSYAEGIAGSIRNFFSEITKPKPTPAPERPTPPQGALPQPAT